MTKRLKETEDYKIVKNNSLTDVIEENDIQLERKRIEILLTVVRENKKKFPKFGDRELEETKVNLNYEENFKIIGI